VRVARHGGAPFLRLAGDGTVHIVFTDGCGFVGREGVWYAVADPLTGDFSPEPVADTLARQTGALAFALDDADRPHVLVWEEHDDEEVTLHASRGESGWAVPMQVADRQAGRALAIDAAQMMHILTLGRDGATHLVGRDGDFAATPLTDNEAFPWNGGALVLDGAGHAHIVFVTGDAEEGDAELWYAIAPVSG
jgi:hypothetical protein